MSNRGFTLRSVLRNRRLIRHFLTTLICAGVVQTCGRDKVPTEVETDSPYALAIYQGDEQIAVVGSAIIGPLAVKVTTAEGSPATNVYVLFSVETGEAVLTDPIVATDADGIASVGGSVGETAGKIEISAAVDGLIGSPVVFHITAVSADATILRVARGNYQRGAVGRILPEPLVVRAADVFGNPTSGVDVSFAVHWGGGSLSNTNATTNDIGEASADWTLGLALDHQYVKVAWEGGDTLYFQAEAHADVPRTVSVVEGDSQRAVVGTVLPEELEVEVTDQYNYLVTGQEVSFSIVSGVGSLDRPVDTTDLYGLARTRLTLGESAGDVSVRATVGEATPVDFYARSYPRMSTPAITKSPEGHRLVWNASTDNEFAGYEVRRLAWSPWISESSPLVFSTTAWYDTTFTDDSLTLGCRYYYRVYARYPDGVVVPSDTCADTAGSYLELGAPAHDLVYDSLRNRLYISLPTLNQIAVISTDSFRIEQRVYIGSLPQGIDITRDGRSLLVALGGAGSIATIDLELMSVSSLDITSELGSSQAYDVVETKPYRVLAVAQTGTKWLVLIKLDEGNAASRVAYGSTRTDPALLADDVRQVVYVGDNFRYRLEKFDTSVDSLPLVLRGDYLSASEGMVMNNEGTKLYMPTGVVFSASDFQTLGVVTPGYPSLSDNGEKLYVAGSDYTAGVFRYSTATLTRESGVAATFFFTRMVLDEDSVAWAIRGERLYAIRTP